jgi:UDP-GlcNAc:undecaprenyl-phosphate/decaprenyl-phosphate GlcNAc-1-phosphate transferase
MLAAPIAIALAITLLLMTALRPLAIGIGLVDRPGGRKAHIGEIPIVGGLAMFAGIFFGFALIPELDGGYWYLLLSGGLLVIVGVLDDKYDIPAEIRLVAQTCAVIIMVYGGGLVVWDIGDPIGVGDVQLGPFALVFTVLVTLTVINAFNLVDGVDGLAGSMTIIALVGIVLAGGMTSDSTAIASVVCASVVGFLVFNYPVYANRRLRSFMGDAGSTLLGLVVVWLTIRVSQGDARSMSPVVGLWFVSVPLFDLFTCFVRRISRGRSPFRPGREHFHHMLYRAGLSVRQTLGVLTLIAVAYAAFGLFGHWQGLPDAVMFYLWAACGAVQFIFLRKASALYRHRRRRGERTQAA